jgi:hypothetical protein
MRIRVKLRADMVYVDTISLIVTLIKEETVDGHRTRAQPATEDGRGPIVVP